MKIGSCNVRIDKPQNIPNCVIVAFDGWIEKGDNSDEIKEHIMKLGKEGYIYQIFDCSDLKFHFDIDFMFFPVISATVIKEYEGIAVFVNLFSTIFLTITDLGMKDYVPNVDSMTEAIEFIQQYQRKQTPSPSIASKESEEKK